MHPLTPLFHQYPDRFLKDTISFFPSTIAFEAIALSERTLTVPKNWALLSLEESRLNALSIAMDFWTKLLNLKKKGLKKRTNVRCPFILRKNDVRVAG